MSFTANLRFLLETFSVTDEQFVSQFMKTSGTKLRPSDVRKWLTGRQAYATNLEQITVFWRTWVPSLEGAHFYLPPEEFQKLVLAKKNAGDQLGGVVIDLDPAQVADELVTSLCGSFRIYRFDFREARVVSEALSIARRNVGNKSVLDATLWSPTAQGTRKFNGTAIILGTNVYLVMHDADTTSSMMRFINLTTGFGTLNDVNYGLMSGVFDTGGTTSAMGMAIEKLSPDPKTAEAKVKPKSVAEASWVIANATGTTRPEILVALQRPIPPKIS